MVIYQLGDDVPRIAATAWVADSARVIGRHGLVGAGAVVTEGKEFPDGALIIGAPARVAREVTPEQILRMKRGALNHVEQADRHRRSLKRIA